MERNELGKEVRHPVILTAKEKMIAKTVNLAFKVTSGLLLSSAVTLPSYFPANCVWF